MRRLAALVALTAVPTLLLSAASPAVAEAQSLGERLKRKAEEAAKRKAEERTEKRAGEAADKALDKVECAASMPREGRKPERRDGNRLRRERRRCREQGR